jgi:hypothetical protein
LRNDGKSRGDVLGAEAVGLAIRRAETLGDVGPEAGVVTGQPGLYFVALHFLYAMSSTMIHGVGRDVGARAVAV